jgi:hypothetical protein
MTLQLLHSEFPSTSGKFDFLFISVQYTELNYIPAIYIKAYFNSQKSPFYLTYM